MLGLVRRYARKCATLVVALLIIWLIVSVIEVNHIKKGFGEKKRPEHDQLVNDIQDEVLQKVEGFEKDLQDTFVQNKLLYAEAHKQIFKNYKVKKKPAPVLPVLVIACDRVTVKRCLDQLIRYRPSKETFPIIVSQDCGHRPTFDVIKHYVDSDSSISLVTQPDLSDIPVPPGRNNFKGYYKISRHYKFALNHVLDTLGHEAVIIVEDDLDISPDFFEYFLGTYPLLLEDSSLWCISAWNDNGKKGLIEESRPDLLHRTQFFPGLGWMLRRETWGELVGQWPEAYWDDWLRTPGPTKMRSCIRPEISRTYSFGEFGVSRGQYFKNHLRLITLNQDFVEFTKLNLSYLIETEYNANLRRVLLSLPRASARDAAGGGGGRGGRGRGRGAPAGNLVVLYDGEAEFTKSAQLLGLMKDWRGGIPRTSYYGVVTCFINGRRIYLAPKNPKDW